MPTNNIHDLEYNRLLNLVLNEGRWKNNRTGVRTQGVFGAQAKFDLRQGFPLLTTKKVFFKGIVHELLWFIKGDTNIKYLVDNGVNIWNEWAYKRFTTAVADSTNHNLYECKTAQDVITSQEEFVARVKSDPTFAKKWGELGEGTYGGMWRAFPYYYPEYQIDIGTGFKQTVDQLKNAVEKLKKNPDDRRIIVSAWHPYWVDHCALPPCHVLFHFNTEELSYEEREVLLHKRLGITDGRHRCADMPLHQIADGYNIPRRRLNCLLYQRSCDLFLGVPFNIASYALLTHMVAQVCGMEPGTFTHAYGDLHIYENHMEQVKTQLSRDSFAPPTLQLAPKSSLFDFRFEDVILSDYQSHEAIKGAVAV